MQYYTLRMTYSKQLYTVEPLTNAVSFANLGTSFRAKQVILTYSFTGL